MKSKVYTGRGDDGTTTLCDDKGRIKKNACSIAALGSLDEVNSFVGWCRAVVRDEDIKERLEDVQQALFILQAELAGADKAVTRDLVKKLESMIAELEKELPVINTFLVSGETEMTAMLDVARTMVRRAERAVIAGVEKKEISVAAPALAYINRLSSLLYVMARVVSVREGAEEGPPTYR